MDHLKLSKLLDRTAKIPDNKREGVNKALTKVATEIDKVLSETANNVERISASTHMPVEIGVSVNLEILEGVTAFQQFSDKDWQRLNPRLAKSGEIQFFVKAMQRIESYFIKWLQEDVRHLAKYAANPQNTMMAFLANENGGMSTTEIEKLNGLLKDMKGERNALALNGEGYRIDNLNMYFSKK